MSSDPGGGTSKLAMDCLTKGRVPCKQVRNPCVYSRPSDRVWFVSSCQAVSSCPWPGELAKGPSLPPPPPPLFSQCEAHGPPIGVGREKKYTNVPVKMHFMKWQTPSTSTPKSTLV